MVQSTSLTRRVFSASAWSMTAYATTLVIRFGSNLVLTRFLMPDAYGLMAVAMVVLSALAMFSDIGLKPNVIQNKNGHDPEFLNTVWVTQIVRNFCLWLFAVFAAVGISIIRDFGLISSIQRLRKSGIALRHFRDVLRAAYRRI